MNKFFKPSILESNKKTFLIEEYFHQTTFKGNFVFK